MESLISFEKAASLTKTDPQARAFFEKFGGGQDLKSIDSINATKARPFVSPMLWATFSAMHAIAAHALIRLTALRSGLGQDFTNDEAIRRVINAALPQNSDFLNKDTPDRFHLLPDELESQILTEIQKMLTGVEADEASINQAAEILAQADAFKKQVQASSAAET